MDVHVGQLHIGHVSRYREWSVKDLQTRLRVVPMVHDGDVGIVGRALQVYWLKTILDKVSEILEQSWIADASPIAQSGRFGVHYA
jgi:hypothetical protein